MAQENSDQIFNKYNIAIEALAQSESQVIKLQLQVERLTKYNNHLIGENQQLNDMVNSKDALIAEMMTVKEEPPVVVKDLSTIKAALFAKSTSAPNLNSKEEANSKEEDNENIGVNSKADDKDIENSKEELLISQGNLNRPQYILRQPSSADNDAMIIKKLNERVLELTREVCCLRNSYSDYLPAYLDNTNMATGSASSASSANNSASSSSAPSKPESEDVKELKAKIYELSEEVRCLTNKNFDLNKINKMLTNSEATAAEMLFLKARVDELTAELTDTQQSRDAAISKCKDLTWYTSDLAKKSQSVLANSEKYEETIKNLEIQIVENEDCIIRLTQANDMLTTENLASSNKIDGLIRTLAALDSGASTTEELVSKSHELSELKEKFHDTQADNIVKLVNMDERIDGLVAENARLTKELNECLVSLDIQKKMLVRESSAQSVPESARTFNTILELKKENRQLKETNNQLKETVSQLKAMMVNKYSDR